jgi:hypothetical protein
MDSTSPLANPGVLAPDAPVLAVTQESYNTFPGVSTYGIQWGDVQVCKAGGGTGSPATQFSFSVAVNGGTPSNVNLDLPAGGGTVCTVVHTSLVDNEFVETVVVTEATPPTDWALTAINTKQLLFTGLTYDAPRLNDSENLGTATASLFINNDMARQVTFTNTFTPPAGNNGCTPGYWKQAHHFDSWTGYAPADGFNATFGIGTNWFANSYTLLNGLQAGGGGKYALARHAVAALLNAASGFYPMSESEVIDAVQDAYDGTTGIESTKNIFANNNELGCPLN